MGRVGGATLQKPMWPEYKLCRTVTRWEVRSVQGVENLAVLNLDSRAEGMQQGHALCVSVLSR